MVDAVQVTPEPTADPAAAAPATPPAAGDTPAAPTPERPSWLPEKFDTPEALAKSYAELEQRLSAPPKDDPPAASDDDPAVDVAALTQEFVDQGAISDASRAELKKRGIGDDLIDLTLAGVKAQVKAAEDSAHARTGGKENYDGMLNWAKESLSPAEIAAFDSSVGEGGEIANLAIDGLYAKFSSQEAAGLVTPGSKGAGTADVFESNAQLTAAMKDPRYKTDPAYRASVAAKLGRSSIL